MARLSPIQRVTIQASLLNMTSTILAQILRHYKQTSTLSISQVEVLPILHFLFWCLASTPPNYLWQELLENRFPGYPTASAASLEGAGKDGGASGSGGAKVREKEKEKEKEKGSDEKVCFISPHPLPLVLLMG